MTDIAPDPAPADAGDAAPLEVAEVLNRAREAVARSRELLASAYGAPGPAPDAPLPPADPEVAAA